MPKFTKGPWQVWGDWAIKDCTPAENLIGTFEPIGHSVNVAFDNAHLIAAAPDMYAMIDSLAKELFIAIDEVNDQRASKITNQTENEPDYMDMQTIHEAQLLLKKARGK